MEIVDDKVQIEKYSAYKDSGVEWLEKIPKHWNLSQIKKICGVNEKTLPENTNKSFCFQYVDIGSVTYEEGVFITEAFIFKKSPSRARRIAKENDTIISTVRTYLKAIDFISNEKSSYIYSTGFAVLSPKVKYMNPQYFSFAIKSDSFTNQVDKFSKGMSYPAINSFELSQLLILIPPLEEQSTIAQFLDRKTSLIDKAIAIKEKQIELLKERRQILIHKAVTRGLDPCVKMKDSGVEWIGEIPEHWDVVVNRILFTERNEAGNESLPILSVSIHSAVSSEELGDDENIRGKIRIEDKSYYKLVLKNDIAFNMMRAWQGAIGAVRTRGMVSPAYIVAQIKGPITADFFEHQYRTEAFIKQMDKHSKGITDFRKRLYWNEFKQLKTALPPIDEQYKIIDFIANISVMISKSISLKDSEIERIKEYKSTLINSAVTGKIKVC